MASGFGFIISLGNVHPHRWSMSRRFWVPPFYPSFSINELFYTFLSSFPFDCRSYLSVRPIIMAPRFIGIWGGQDNHSQSGIENVALWMNLQPPDERIQEKLLSDHLPFTIHWNTIGSGCREMTAYCNAANQSRSHFSTPPMTLERRMHHSKSMQVDLWV